MKKILFVLAAACLVGVGVSLATSQNETPHLLAPVADTEYTITISDVADIKNGTVTNSNGGYNIYFDHTDIGYDSVLKDGGWLKNTTLINGISSVNVTVSSGEVKILGGFYQTGTSSIGYDVDNPFAEGITASGTADFSDARPGYFAIVAVNGAATIDSITIKYACVETKHTFTTYFYSANQPNSTNNVYMIIDSNWTTNNEWINGKSWEATPMTYVGRSGDYYKYSYSASLPYGLVRYQFIANSDSDVCETVSRYDDWKPASLYLNGDTTVFCYCDDGFVENKDATTVFDVYDHELANPYKTTFNVTFDDGSADFSYVGIKTRTGSDNYAYRGSFVKSDGVWSFTFNSGELKAYDFFIEAYAESLGGNPEIWKDGGTQTGFHITITDDDVPAVVNINAGVVNTLNKNVTGSATAVSNCTLD